MLRMLKYFFSLSFFLNLFLSINSQTYSDITYTEDFSNFVNPDRGFYHDVENIDYNQLLNYRNEGISLVLKNYHLDNYKDGDIEINFLNNIENDFQIIRDAGMKCIIRFSYTESSQSPYGDAPLNIVLRHIEQLKPILKNNSDVILTFQAGFIGAWGEWYYTDYFSESPGNVTEENWNDRRTLVDSLLNALPADVMVQVRTPKQKYKLLQMTNYTPVTTEQAYSSLPVARIAHHNDCFVSGSFDQGTYADTTIEKPYLEEDSKYTIVGGETCNQCSESHCANAVIELSRFHWSFLNIDYHPDIINDWRNEACFETIQKKLGYRYKLISMNVQDNASQGSEFNFSIKLINTAWANPVKRYYLKFILRNTSSGQEFAYISDTDIRFWNINDTINIDINSGISQNIPEGQYQLLMALVNKELNLSSRAEYSIRLANNNVWEESTGYNNLNHTLTINNTYNIPSYTGIHIFGQIDSISQTPILSATSYGNNNLISWLRPENDSTYTLLQRSDNGISFEDIVNNKAENIYYIDKNLDTSKTYYYRAKYFHYGAISNFSDTITQSLAGNYPFADISIDGNIEDWNPIPVIANGIIYDSIATIQFYNSKDSLFALIKTKNIDSVKLFLDTHNNFDYLISQDSLYQQNNSYNFIKNINVKKESNYIELAVSLADIQFDDYYLVARVYVGQQEIWWNNKNFYYTKYSIPEEITNFGIEPSVNNPFTRLKIKWKMNSSLDGYIIERSIGDSLNFQKLTDLPSSSSFYIDEGLDSSLTYYYRIFSYKDINRSPYSVVKWMKPGEQLTGLPNIDNNKIEIMCIAPNPVTGTSVISFNISKPTKAIIELYNIKGKLLKKYYQGIIYPDTRISIGKNNLQGGIYTLIFKSNKYNSIKKIIIK